MLNYYKEFILLLRGSEDGFTSKIFHEKCDNKGRMFAIVLDTDGNKFGAYTDLNFSKGVYKDGKYRY
jgi:hypothetical protein